MGDDERSARSRIGRRRDASRSVLVVAALLCGCSWDWEPARAIAADASADATLDSDSDADVGTDAAADALEAGDADCPATVDVTSDPNNCGKCGVVCRAGYACVSKTCGNVVTQLAAGRAHTCALRRDGSVDCWGDNSHGQLGDGTTTGRPKRAPVKGLPGKPSQLVAGGDHTCARIGGSVWCWGADTYGELGDASTASARTVPVQAIGVSTATSVDVGGTFACAILSTGHAICWGANDKGQLGDGTTTPRSKAQPDREVGSNKGTVEGLPLLSISAGPSHACSRRASGGVAFWGDNSFSQSGVAAPTTTPFFVSPTDGLPAPDGSFIDDASAVAAGGKHCCAVRAMGVVICWGADDRGQLGDDDIAVGTGKKDFVSVVALPAASPSTLTLGDEHTCVRSTIGPVYCWGRNDLGQLGIGTTGADQSVPQQIPDLKNVIELVAGGSHTCARTSSGDVWCWGSNASGQLGDGSHSNRPKPVEPLEVP